MINLPVDVNSGEWQHVRRYVEQRIGEQSEICTNPLAEERDRLIAAVRIDELRVLLAAPADTQRMTAQRVDSPVQPTY